MLEKFTLCYEQITFIHFKGEGGVSTRRHWRNLLDEHWSNKGTVAVVIEIRRVASGVKVKIVVVALLSAVAFLIEGDHCEGFVLLSGLSGIEDSVSKKISTSWASIQTARVTIFTIRSSAQHHVSLCACKHEAQEGKTKYEGRRGKHFDGTKIWALTFRLQGDSKGLVKRKAQMQPLRGNKEKYNTASELMLTMQMKKKYKNKKKEENTHAHTQVNGVKM